MELYKNNLNVGLPILPFYQGGRGHWAVYYTSTQSLIITFSNSLALQPWGLWLNFDWLVGLVKCSKVSTTNCNLEKG